MDRVPDSAVCNEAVKLAQKKGFYNLKPFCKRVLEPLREENEREYPSRKENLSEISFSQVFHAGAAGIRWLNDYGERINGEDAGRFPERKTGDIRCRTYLIRGRDL